MPRTVEQIREGKRLYMARKRAANPEAARAYHRAYHHRNGEKNREKMRNYAHRRFFWNKMTKLRAEDRPSHIELARLWKKQRGRCALTGRKLTRQNAEIDHRHPKIKGGGDNIENLQWTCRAANRAKRDLTEAEFTVLCSDVMCWLGDRIASVEAMTLTPTQIAEVTPR